jgi:hypothetical protein
MRYSIADGRLFSSSEESVSIRATPRLRHPADDSGSHRALRTGQTTSRET